MNKLIGELTCPLCGNKQKMEIPKISCLHSYQCEKCEVIVKAQKECCVFCEYGDKKCPTAHKGD